MAKDDKSSEKNQSYCKSKTKCFVIAVIVILAALFIGFKLGKHACFHHRGHSFHGYGHHGAYWKDYGMRMGMMNRGGGKFGGRGGMHGLMRLADADNDYQISREEFNALFDRLDSDGNGSISNEFLQFHDLMRDKQ